VKIPCPENDLKISKMSLELRDKILKPTEFDHVNSKIYMAITLSKKL